MNLLIRALPGAVWQPPRVRLSHLQESRHGDLRLCVGLDRGLVWGCHQQSCPCVLVNLGLTAAWARLRRPHRGCQRACPTPLLAQTALGSGSTTTATGGSSGTAPSCLLNVHDPAPCHAMLVHHEVHLSLKKIDCVLLLSHAQDLAGAAQASSRSRPWKCHNKRVYS